MPSFLRERRFREVHLQTLKKTFVLSVKHLCSLISVEYSHVGVQLEVSGPVSEGEVVLGQFGLGRVEGHLVSGQPSLVAQHSGGVDDGTLEVDVAAQVDKVTLVARLQLTALLTEKPDLGLNVCLLRH